MLHSGLSKSQPLPLLAAASSPRRALLAGLLPAGYFSKSVTSSPTHRPTTTAATRTLGGHSRFGLGSRASFSTVPDGSDSVSGGRALPWLAATSVDSSAPSARASAGRSSSWESSADKFFSKGNQIEQIEASEDRVSYREGAIRVEENETIDNPKWGRIKDKFRRNVARDGGPRGRGERFRGERFDKPDVRRWNKQEDWGRKTWKEAGESTVPKMVGEGVYGVGPFLRGNMLSFKRGSAL